MRKSLRTKVKDYAITEGGKLYIQIRIDVDKGIKYYAITVKEAAEEYLKYQKTLIGDGDFNVVEGRYNTIDTQIRTFITKLANSGVNVPVIAELASHKSIQTTQRYIDINDNLCSNAVELV